MKDRIPIVLKCDHDVCTILVHVQDFERALKKLVYLVELRCTRTFKPETHKNSYRRRHLPPESKSRLSSVLPSKADQWSQSDTRDIRRWDRPPVTGVRRKKSRTMGTKERTSKLHGILENYWLKIALH